MVFLSGSDSVKVFYHLFIFVLPLEIQVSREEVGIPLTGLTMSHLCVCLKPGPGFPMSYVMIFFL